MELFGAAAASSSSSSGSSTDSSDSSPVQVLLPSALSEQLNALEGSNRSATPTPTTSNSSSSSSRFGWRSSSSSKSKVISNKQQQEESSSSTSSSSKNYNSSSGSSSRSPTAAINHTEASEAVANGIVARVASSATGVMRARLDARELHGEEKEGEVPGVNFTPGQELVLSNLVRVLNVISTHVAKQDEDRTNEFL